MVRADLVLLSSSPPRHFQSCALELEASSSPNLSPTIAITHRRPTIKYGSQAALPSQDAAAAYTTTTRLLSHSQSTDVSRPPTASESIDQALTLEPMAKARNVGKSCAKETDTSLVATTEKKARKPRARKADTIMIEGEQKEKPARKSRSKKDSTGGQTQLPKGKITKAVSGSTLLKTETISRHFCAVAEGAEPCREQVDDTLQLVEAVKRRTKWTPAKATTNTTLRSGPPEDQNSSKDEYMPIDVDDSPESPTRFSDLLSSFVCSKSGESITVVRGITASDVKKRKLVEMVRTNRSGPSLQATSKLKAARKKPRTITDLATSAYAVQSDEDEVSAPLLQYFSIRNGGSAIDTACEFKVPLKPRSRNHISGSTKKALPKIGPILLSPQSALKQVDRQDFVFGTSSQLAREESPTLLRDLHQAMIVSNQVEDDPFQSPSSSTSISAARAIDKAGSSTAKRTLWTAASRDTEGDLMNVEVVDLTISPELKKSQAAHQVVPESQNVDAADVAKPSNQADDEWHDIDKEDNCSDAPPKAVAVTDYVKYSSEAAMDLQTFNSRISVNENDKPSSQASKSNKAWIESPVKKKKRQTNTATVIEKPNFEAYTTAQLAKEIASYHFKPVRKRDQMISLLEKCWQGKQRIALGDVRSNSTLHTPPVKVAQKTAVDVSTTSPSKGRGRRRTGTEKIPSLPKAKGKSKDSKARSPRKTEFSSDSDTPLANRRTPKKRTTVRDEISDSETPITPSPPRRRTAQIGSPPLPLQLSVSEEMAVSPTLSPTSQQVQLYQHITRAVRSAPRTQDAQNPSWHEKMLLYDPIVLEDLTAWLNTGPLERSGWDGEVDVKEVKKWCNEKSICCLWRANLRGGTRSRY
ncbi:MAG: 5'-flap endonuclease [Claussenomyces sp. TS43310]|nr:MAG: 5'-flap endonuclease [Claussenomyces sp. TS43310]